MNQPYTSDLQFSASVTIGSRYCVKPTDNSPSLHVSAPLPSDTFILNFLSPQVLQNAVPLHDYSVGILPAEGSQPADCVKFEEAKKYFEENKAQLLAKYRGMFIAIMASSVVDQDKDFSELAKRVYEKFGYQAIYMPFVQSEPAVLRIPSPRVGKHRVDDLRKEV